MNISALKQAWLLSAMLVWGFFVAVVINVIAQPTPRPPESQTFLGREIDALSQTVVDTSNDVDAVKLLVLAVVAVASFGMVSGYVERRRADTRLEAMLNANAAQTQQFTDAVNTFSAVTMGVGQANATLTEIAQAQRISAREALQRDRAIYRRIEAGERRVIGSLGTFSERMVHETGVALREGQIAGHKAAAELLLKSLPALLQQAATRQQTQQPTQVVVPGATSVIVQAPDTKPLADNGQPDSRAPPPTG